MKAISNVRWRIGWLMFAGVAINYLDRVNVSHAIIVISKEFNLTSIQKGYILSSFSFGYVLLMVVGGALIYKFGPKRVTFVAMLLLSATTIYCGFTTGLYTLLFARFLIGVFECPTFPANAYTTVTWFPKLERAKATSLFDSGSYVGSALAAPMIIYLIAQFSWRVCFVFSGVLGFLWCIVWWKYFRDKPKDHVGISREELVLLEDNDYHEFINTKIQWRQYIGNRKVIGSSVGFFCYNYLKSFHLTWFPTYLVEYKKMSFIKLGFVGFIPPLCAIAGELYTGYLIDKSIANGASATYAKKIPICMGLLLSSVIILSLTTSNFFIIMGLITISYVFLISASVGIWTIPAELADAPRSVSLIGSIQNSFSNIAGIIAPIVTGYLYYETKSFFVPFLISCCIAIVGAYAYWFIVGDLKKIVIK
jgi:ACS family D-galactonate transporter-like MFS transporter